MKNDRVVITVYKETKTFLRKDAYKFFKEGTMCCDPNSSECARYEYILDCLKYGDTIIDADDFASSSDCVY
jgi:hypothetical protein